MEYTYEEVIEELKNEKPSFFDEITIDIQGRKYILIKENIEEYFINNKLTLPEYAIALVPINFAGKEICKEIICKNWIFAKHAFFLCSSFNEKISFEFATFCDVVSFGETKFKYSNSSHYDKFSFLSTKFLGITDFTASIFYSEVVFYETYFERDVSFGWATFKKNCSFYRCIFKNNIRFDSTIFQDKLDFSALTINQIFFHKTNFEKQCEFKSLLLFNPSTISFESAIFNDCVIFSFFYNVEENLKKTHLKIIFYLTSFRKECYIDFNKVKEMNFKPFITLDENNKVLAFNSMNNFFILSNIYKNLGENNHSLEMFYQYKKYERRNNYNWSKENNIISNIKKKGQAGLSYLFLDLISKYFTNWKRILIVTAIFLFICSVIYFIFMNNLILDGQRLCSYTSYTTCDKIRIILYYTLITFTTIGYGDIHPQGCLQIIAAIEGIFGLYLTSMFMVTLAKKVLG